MGTLVLLCKISMSLGLPVMASPFSLPSYFNVSGFVGHREVSIQSELYPLADLEQIF